MTLSGLISGSGTEEPSKLALKMHLVITQNINNETYSIM